MTLTTLLERVLEHTDVPPSTGKDLRTSLRYLAKALGKASPEQCFEEDFSLPESLWKDRLNIYLGSLTPSPSPHTVRNTHNNLSFLFRKAQELKILQPLHGLPTLPTPFHKPPPCPSRRPAKGSGQNRVILYAKAEAPFLPELTERTRQVFHSELREIRRFIAPQMTLEKPERSVFLMCSVSWKGKSWH
jgi:hypothetical protein